jgi:hypothetical membrane protein
MPLWGVVTAAAAPILLVAGWTIAARLQPGGFDPVTETISDLAGADASHRWVMTAAILGTGACQVATAVALRPAALPGRLVFAAGGVCTILVGLSPLPSAGQAAPVHAVVAAGSFAALAAWPLVSWRQGESVPWGLRRGVALSAGCGLVAVTAWFFRDAVLGTGTVGLSERAAAVLLNLWPLAVAVSARRLGRASQAPTRVTNPLVS